MPKSSFTVPTPGAPESRGRRRRVRLVTAVLALLGVAGYGVYQVKLHIAPEPGCTVTAGGRSVRLEPAQAANASTIAAVADSRNLPERALTIALATAMQESALRNLDHGDRDSVGLFQQRPSQGWGTAAQIMDPVYSANEFFDGLVKIKGYSRLPLTVAAQWVQRSGFPQAYAKHETDAALLSSALTGRQSAALTCVTAGGDSDGTLVGGDPATIRTRLLREFGSQVRSSTSPARASAAGGKVGGGLAGKDATAADGADPAGDAGSTVRTVSVDSTARRGGDDAAQRGWALAQWAVAHAAELKIAEVSYGGRKWSAASSVSGWQNSGSPAPAASNTDVRISVVQ